MSKRPNVLVVYADQMRYDCMGAAGNPVIKTPHLDSLATQSVFFEHAYTSFPLCCPFRASFMTGMYAHSNGMYANHYPIPLGQQWLADRFNDAGYLTGYVGKWHLNGGAKFDFVPADYRCGFQRFIGFSRGHMYFNHIFYRDDDPTPRTTTRYEPDAQTDHLIEIMEDARERERPFFAMINYGLPHPPLHMPDYYRELHEPTQVPVRANTPQHEEARARDFLARYYGLCTSVDDNLGRLLAWIEEAGLTEDTLVMFLSDHGEMAREFGRSGKKVYHEASMHVPYIVRWPAGIEPGRRVSTIVDPAVDSYRTLLELCGIEPPAGVQGQSLAPLMVGKGGIGREYVFYEILKEAEGPERHPVPERGIRTREWLYVRSVDGPMVLFDLKNDPLEMNNLVRDARFSEKLDELDVLLVRHMAQTDDDWAREAVFPPPDFMSHSDADSFHKDLLARAVPT